MQFTIKKFEAQRLTSLLGVSMRLGILHLRSGRPTLEPPARPPPQPPQNLSLYHSPTNPHAITIPSTHIQTHTPTTNKLSTSNRAKIKQPKNQTSYSAVARAESHAISSLHERRYPNTSSRSSSAITNPSQRPPTKP
jgi:hypothetical protein